MPTIFEPKTISALLNIMKRYPDSIIYSGGTETILQSQTRMLTLPENLIYTGKIEELQKMKRSERYLEIGASARISQIIDKGRNIIPVILLEAMKKITPPNFKNILTLGGMICSRTERNSVFAVLCILDARIEIKSVFSSRWISASHLFNGSRLDLEPGEIVTKVRIYLNEYDINIHRKIDNDFSRDGGVITFSAIASMLKGNINFIKFIYTVSDQYVIRSKETEAGLSGQNIPLNDKFISLSLSHFSEHLNSKYSSLIDYRKNMVINTYEWFLRELGCS